MGWIHSSKAAAKKQVEAEVKGLNAITAALDPVIDQIQHAGQPAPSANGMVGIRVIVKDKATGKPVAGAVVTKMPRQTTGLMTTLGATDDSGQLSVRMLAGEKLNLLVTGPNYREAAQHGGSRTIQIRRDRARARLSYFSGRLQA